MIYTNINDTQDKIMESASQRGRPARQALYWQIVAVLQGRILSGWFKEGESIGTEHALGKQFGVSRTTIRQAISELKEKGLVESRRGAGTFVTGNMVEVKKDSHFMGPTYSGFLDDLFEEASWAKDSIVCEQKIALDPVVRKTFNIDAKEKFMRIRAVRRRGDQIFGVGDDYLTREASERLLPPQFDGQTVLQRKAAAGLDPASNLQRIEPALAPDDISELLEIENGTPVLSICGVSRSGDGKVISYYRLWLPQGYGLQLRLDRVGPIPDRLSSPGDVVAPINQ